MRSQKNCRFSFHILVSFFFLFHLHASQHFCSGSSDTITSTKFIKDPATIVSNGSIFELGFFSPLDSTRRYVGIWFYNISEKTVVWIANRDNPLKDNSGTFTISKDGNLVVLDGNRTVLWSSNVSSPVVNNTSAKILDTGNLVLQDTASGFRIWESFKHPSDVFLPYMTLVANKDINSRDKNVQLTSWKNPFDPSTGNFSYGLDVQHLPELAIWINGRNNPYWRSGPWNGNTFIGAPEITDVYLSGFNLAIANQTYTLSSPYGAFNIETFTFLFLSSQGNVYEKYWDAEEAKWKADLSTQLSQCDFYGACGAFGICNLEASPICGCLRGFEPKHEEEWNQGNWSRGCVRKTPLNCTEAKDGFFRLDKVKLPFLEEWSSPSFPAKDCREECFENCSCAA